jgi:hypothetical protein
MALAHVLLRKSRHLPHLRGEVMHEPPAVQTSEQKGNGSHLDRAVVRR